MKKTQLLKDLGANWRLAIGVLAMVLLFSQAQCLHQQGACDNTDKSNGQFMNLNHICTMTVDGHTSTIQAVLQ